MGGLSPGVRLLTLSDASCRDHMLQTDLHLASEDGNLERVKDHVEGRDGARKIPVLCRDENGDNSLHYAARTREIEVVKYLLAHSCDPNVTGQHGRTPVMLCAIGGEMAIAELLIRWGLSPPLSVLLMCSLVLFPHAFWCMPLLYVEPVGSTTALSKR